MTTITNLNDLKTQIKNTVDLKAYLEKEGIIFRKKSGSNWQALCPFHNEKTPSFTVSDTSQSYHCFGCGKHGDIFSYIQETESVSWKESVIYLAREYHIQYELNKDDSKKYSQYARAYDLLDDLANYYKMKFNELADSHPAKKMIADRNLDYTSAEYGYAPESQKDQLDYMTQKGYTHDELKALGLMYDKGYLQQVNRLIFIIRNYMGKVIGFTGRALTQKDIESRKYINSTDSIVFHKKNVVYNINNAKKQANKDKLIYLVEGQFDVAAMTAHGYTNTVAISGTAFTNEQLRDILKAVGENGNIVLLLDDDEAGQKAANKIFREHSSIQTRLYQINLIEGQDPCDYLQTHDKLPKMETFVEKAYLKIRNSFNYSSISDKTEFITTLQTELTQYIKDSILREQYLRRACSYVGFAYDQIQVIIDNKSDKDTITQQIQEATNSSKNNDSNTYILLALNILFSYPEYFKCELKKAISKDKFNKTMRILARDVFQLNKKLVPENYEDNSPEQKMVRAILAHPFDNLDERDIKTQYYYLLDKAIEIKNKEREAEKKRRILTALEGDSDPEVIKSLLSELSNK